MCWQKQKSQTCKNWLWFVVFRSLKSNSDRDKRAEVSRNWIFVVLVGFGFEFKLFFSTSVCFFFFPPSGVMKHFHFIALPKTPVSFSRRFYSAQEWVIKTSGFGQDRRCLNPCDVRQTFPSMLGYSHSSMMDWKLFQINTWKQISTSQVGDEVFIQPLFIQGRFAEHVRSFSTMPWFSFKDLRAARRDRSLLLPPSCSNWKLSVLFKGTTVVSAEAGELYSSLKGSVHTT